MAAGEEFDVSEVQALFSLRKPPDVAAGLSSGLKSAAKGVLAGTIGLVAAPAIGAAQEGISGFAKGAAAGLAGAIVLPATGVAVGLTQVGRGILNTPEAVRERSKGKQWDKKYRKWIKDPGNAVVVRDEPAEGGRSNHKSMLGKGNYYELLGVRQSASSDEIKRAYYLSARKYHPDKCPNDPEAHERFQQLAEAYQVLSNAELRKKYDAHGEKGLDLNFVEGAEFFAALFGSDRFEHLVGELALATAARLGPELDSETMTRMQASRVLMLSQLLAALLRRYVEGDEEGFISSMKVEASELVNASFGGKMMGIVGRIYESQAKMRLGNFFEGRFVALKAQGRSLRTQFKAADLAIKAYMAQRDLEKVEKAALTAQSEVEKARMLRRKEGAPLSSVVGESLSVHQHDGSRSHISNDKAIGNDTIEMKCECAGEIAGEVSDVDIELLMADVTTLRTEQVRLEEACLPIVLDAMWAVNVIDIDQTLRKVCKRVLQDQNLSKFHRLRRAEALLKLGEIFKDAAAHFDEASNGIQSATQHFEEAMRQVVERKMQGN